MFSRRTPRLVAMLWFLAALAAVSTSPHSAWAAPTPAPDHSLPLQDYLDAGISPIDRPWTLDDYEKAAKVLGEIAGKDVTQLPRFNSKTSGELFAHLIDPKNLDIFIDKNVAVEKRVALAQKITSYGPVFIVYLKAAKPDSVFDSETLELAGVLLRAEVAASQVIKEFAASHPEIKDSEAYKKMPGGYALSVGGMLMMMLDPMYVRKSEAARFTAELKEILPKLVPLFEEQARAAFKAKVKDAADKETDAGLKQALGELVEALN